MYLAILLAFRAAWPHTHASAPPWQLTKEQEEFGDMVILKDTDNDAHQLKFQK